MDYKNSTRDGERVIIDIKEFLWKLLEQWKAIVLFLIIFSLVFLLATYVLDNRGAEDVGPETVLTPEQQLDGLKGLGKTKVQSAYRMTKEINELNEYVAKAPIMQINPKNANTVVSLWSIEAESNYGKIADVYTSEAAKYELAAGISEALDGKYSVAELSDMIEIKTNAAEDFANVSMTVYLPDNADTEQVKDAVSSAVSAAGVKYSASVGTHSLNLVSMDVRKIASDYVADKQLSVYSGMYTLHGQRKFTSDSLTGDQKTTYNNLVNGTDIVINQVTHTPLFSFKRLVLGLILGFVIYLAVLLWRVLSGGKVQSPSHAADIFGINNLGECYPEKEKTPANIAFCDYGVVKCRHKGCTDVSKNSAEAGETIAAILRKDDKNSVVLVSSLNAEDHTKAYTEALKKELTDKGLTVTEASLDSKNGASVGEDVLMSSDGVVMLVDKKESSLKDIKDICNKCDYLSVPLLGAVYVG